MSFQTCMTFFLMWNEEFPECPGQSFACIGNIQWQKGFRITKNHYNSSFDTLKAESVSSVLVILNVSIVMAIIQIKDL